PEALDAAGLRAVVQSFVAAARRALAAGFQAVELHAAHGYLLHQFLSPLSNRRDDAYGGTFAGRTRLVREVVAAVRAEWPERLPLLLRLSATDWAEGGWGVDETVELCRGLAPLGVDLFDISSGGLLPSALPPAGPGYQAPFAERIRREAKVKTGAVGLITAPEQADHVIRSGQADVVLLGRELLRDPYFALHAATRLGQEGPWPRQYLRAGP
ncbi:MAG: oxidoreductase, partial [Anaeromyxobacteraceae bacterium]